MDQVLTGVFGLFRPGFFVSKGVKKMGDAERVGLGLPSAGAPQATGRSTTPTTPSLPRTYLQRSITEINLEEADPKATITLAEEHLKAGVKINASTEDQFKVNLNIYAYVLEDLGYQIDRTNYQTLCQSLQRAAAAYAQKNLGRLGLTTTDVRKAEGGELTGLLLSALFFDHQSRWYNPVGDGAVSFSGQKTPQFKRASCQKLIRQYELKDEATILRLSAEAAANGFTLPATPEGEAGRQVAFLARLLTDAGYDIDFSNAEARLASVRSALSQFNQERGLEAPAGTISAAGFLSLLDLAARPLTARAERSAVQFVSGQSGAVRQEADAQLEAVASGRVRLFLIYDLEKKTYTVYEVANGRSREIPLAEHFAAQLFTAGGDHANPFPGMEGAIDQKSLAIFQQAALLAADNNTALAAITSLSARIRSTCPREYQRLKGKDPKESLSDADLLDLQSIASQLELDPTKENLSKIWGAIHQNSLVGEVGRAVARIRKIKEFLGLPLPIGADQQINQETYQLYLSAYLWDESYLEALAGGKKIGLIIDQKTLPLILHGQQVKAQVERLKQEAPLTLVVLAGNLPEFQQALSRAGLEPALISWEALLEEAERNKTSFSLTTTIAEIWNDQALAKLTKKYRQDPRIQLMARAIAVYQKGLKPDKKPDFYLTLIAEAKRDPAMLADQEMRQNYLAILYDAYAEALAVDPKPIEGLKRAIAEIEKRREKIVADIGQKKYDDLLKGLERAKAKEELILDYEAFRLCGTEDAYKAKVDEIGKRDIFDKENSILLTQAEAEISWHIEQGDIEGARKVLVEHRKELSSEQIRQLENQLLLGAFNLALRSGNIPAARVIARGLRGKVDPKKLAEITLALEEAVREGNKGTTSSPPWPANATLPATVTARLELESAAIALLNEVYSGRVIYLTGNARPLIVCYGESNYVLDSSLGFGKALRQVIETVSLCRGEQAYRSNGQIDFSKLMDAYRQITGSRESDQAILQRLAGSSYEQEVTGWLAVIDQVSLFDNQSAEALFGSGNGLFRFEKEAISIGGQTLFIHKKVGERQERPEIDKLLPIFTKMKIFSGAALQLSVYLTAPGRAFNLELLIRLAEELDPGSTTIAAPAKLTEEQAARRLDLQAGGKAARQKLIERPLTLTRKVIKEEGHDVTYWTIRRGSEVLLVGKDNSLLFTSPDLPAEEFAYLVSLFQGSELELKNLPSQLLLFFSLHSDQIEEEQPLNPLELGGPFITRALQVVGEETLSRELILRALLRALGYLATLEKMYPENKDFWLSQAEGDEDKLARRLALRGTNGGRSSFIPTAQAAEELLAELGKYPAAMIMALPAELRSSPLVQKHLADRKGSLDLLPAGFFDQPGEILVSQRFIEALESEAAKRQLPGYVAGGVPEELTSYYEDLTGIHWSTDPLAALKLALAAKDALPQEETAAVRQGKFLPLLTPDNIRYGVTKAFGQTKFRPVLNFTAGQKALHALDRLTLPSTIENPSRVRSFEDVPLPEGLELSREEISLIKKLREGRTLDDQDILRLEGLQKKLAEAAAELTPVERAKELLETAARALAELLESDNLGFFKRLLPLDEYLLDPTAICQPKQKMKNVQILEAFAAALESGAFVDEKGRPISHLDTHLLRRYIVQRGITLQSGDQALFDQGMSLLTTLSRRLQGRVAEWRQFKTGRPGLGALLDLPASFAEGFVQAGAALHSFSSEDTLQMGVWPGIKRLVYQGGIENGGREAASTEAAAKVAELFAGIDGSDPKKMEEKLTELRQWLDEKVKGCESKHQLLLALAYIHGVLQGLKKLAEAGGAVEQWATQAFQAAIGGESDQTKQEQLWQRSPRKVALEQSCVSLGSYLQLFSLQFEQLNTYLKDDRIDLKTYQLIKETFPGVLDYGFGLFARSTDISPDANIFGTRITDAAALDRFILAGFQGSPYLDMSERTMGHDAASLAKRGLNRVAATLLVFMTGKETNLAKATAVPLVMVATQMLPQTRWLTRIFRHPWISGTITAAIASGEMISEHCTWEIRPESTTELRQHIQENSGSMQLLQAVGNIFNSAQENGLGIDLGQLANTVFLQMSQISPEGEDHRLLDPSSSDMLEQFNLVRPDTVRGAILALEEVIRKAETPEGEALFAELYRDGTIKLNLADKSVRDKLKANLERLKALLERKGAEGKLRLDNILDIAVNDPFWEGDAAAALGAFQLGVFTLDYLAILGKISPADQLFSLDPKKILARAGFDLNDGPTRVGEQVARVRDVIFGQDIDKVFDEPSPSFDIEYPAATLLQMATLRLKFTLSINMAVINGLTDMEEALELLIAAQSASTDEERELLLDQARRYLGNALSILGSLPGQFQRLFTMPIDMLENAWRLLNEDIPSAMINFGFALTWIAYSIHYGRAFVADSLSAVRDFGRILEGKEARLPADWRPSGPYDPILGRFLVRPAVTGTQRALAWIARGGNALINEARRKKQGVSREAYQPYQVGIEDGVIKEWIRTKTGELLAKPIEMGKGVASYFRLSDSRPLRWSSKGLWWTGKNVLQLPFHLINISGKVMDTGSDWLQRPGDVSAFQRMLQAQLDYYSREYGIELPPLERSEAKDTWRDSKRPSREIDPTKPGKRPPIRVRDLPAVLAPREGGALEGISGNPAADRVFNAKFGRTLRELFGSGWQIQGVEVVRIEATEGDAVSFRIYTEPVTGREQLILEVGKQATTENLVKTVQEWRANGLPETSLPPSQSYDVGPVAKDDPAAVKFRESIDATYERSSQYTDTTRPDFDPVFRNMSQAELHQALRAAAIAKDYAKMLAIAHETIRRQTAFGFVLKEGGKYLGSIEGETTSLGEVKGPPKQTTEGYTIEFSSGDILRLERVKVETDGRITAIAYDRSGGSRQVTLKGIELFDTQGKGALALAQRGLVAMETSGGKTFTITAAQVIRAALDGGRRGVFALFPKETLATRDAANQRAILEALGFEVGVITHDMGPDAKRAAYRKAIVFVETSQLMSDWIQDRLCTWQPDLLIPRELGYAIADEIDTLMLDRNTQFIISAGGEGDKKTVKLVRDIWHLTITELQRTDAQGRPLYLQADGRLNEAGEALVKGKAAQLGTTPENMVQYVGEALTALYYEKGRDYHVGRDMIFLIGREGEFQHGRRLQSLLHAFLEVKEGVTIRAGNGLDLMRIPYSHFIEMFRDGFVGSTGSADPYALEMLEVFGGDYYESARRVPRITISAADLNSAPGATVADKVRYIVERELSAQGSEIAKRSGIQFELVLPPETLHQAKEAIRGMTLPAGKKITFLEINPGVVHADSAARQTYFVETAQRRRSGDAPLLFAVESAAEASELKRALEARGIKVQVLDACTAELGKTSKIVQEAARGGVVTIMTNVGGRGTDWYVVEAFAESGMRMVISGVRGYEVAYIQLKGRIGRGGSNGLIEVHLTSQELSALGIEIEAKPGPVQLRDGQLDQMDRAIRAKWDQTLKEEAEARKRSDLYGAEERPYTERFFDFTRRLREAKDSKEIQQLIEELFFQELQRLANKHGFGSDNFRSEVARIFGLELPKGFQEIIRQSGISESQALQIIANRAAGRLYILGDSRVKKAIIQQVAMEVYGEFLKAVEQAQDSAWRHRRPAGREAMAEFRQALQQAYDNFRGSATERIAALRSPVHQGVREGGLRGRLQSLFHPAEWWKKEAATLEKLPADLPLSNPSELPSTPPVETEKPDPLKGRPGRVKIGEVEYDFKTENGVRVVYDSTGKKIGTLEGEGKSLRFRPRRSGSVVLGDAVGATVETARDLWRSRSRKATLVIPEVLPGEQTPPTPGTTASGPAAPASTPAVPAQKRADAPVKVTEVRVSSGKPGALAQALAGLQAGDLVHYQSSETFSFEITAGQARTIDQGRKVQRDLLRRLGLETPASEKEFQRSTDVSLALGELPARMRSGQRLDVRLSNGNTASIFFNGKSYTFQVSSPEGMIEFSLSAKEAQDLRQMKQAVKEIFTLAAKNHPGVAPEVLFDRLMATLNEPLTSQVGKKRSVTLTVPVVDVIATKAALESSLLKTTLTIKVAGREINLQVDVPALYAFRDNPLGSPASRLALDQLLQNCPPQERSAVEAELLRDKQLADLSFSAQGYFRPLVELFFLETYAAELEKAENITPAVERKARETATKKSRGFEAELARRIMEQAQTLDLKRLSPRLVQELFEATARQYQLDLEKMPEAERDRTYREAASRFSLARKPGWRGRVGYWGIDAPGGSLIDKGGALGFHAAKGFLLGCAVMTVIEPVRQLVTTGEIDWGKYGRSVLSTGLGFARFEAITHTYSALGGIKAAHAGHMAIGLETAWGLALASYSNRGIQLAYGSVNLAGFLLTAAAAGRLVNLLPVPTWFKGGLVIGSGLLGGEAASSLGLGTLLKHSPTLAAFLRTDTARMAGTVAGWATPGLTTHLIFGTGSRIATKLGAGRTVGSWLLKWGSRFSGITTFLQILFTSAPLGDEGYHYEGSLQSFALEGRFTRQRMPEMPYYFDEINLKGATSIEADNPLFFELAFNLALQGYLRNYISDSPMGRKEAKLIEAFTNINLQGTEAEVQAALQRAKELWQELLSDERFNTYFTDTLRRAIDRFVATIQADGLRMLSTTPNPNGHYQPYPAFATQVRQEWETFYLQRSREEQETFLSERQAAANKQAEAWFQELTANPQQISAERDKEHQKQKLQTIQEFFGPAQQKPADPNLQHLDPYQEIIRIIEQNSPENAVALIADLAAQYGFANIDLYAIGLLVRKVKAEELIFTLFNQSSLSSGLQQFFEASGLSEFLARSHSAYAADPEALLRNRGDFMEIVSAFILEKEKAQMEAEVLRALNSSSAGGADLAIRREYEAWREMEGISEDRAESKQRFAKYKVRMRYEGDDTAWRREAARFTKGDKAINFILQLPDVLRREFYQHLEGRGYQFTDGLTPEAAFLLLSGAYDQTTPKPIP